MKAEYQWHWEESSQSRQLNMWHQKRSFAGSLAPPCKGILLLSVHPPPQDHVAKCREPPDISSSFFFVKQLVNRQTCLHLQRARERGTGSWWEDCAMWGKPIMLRHLKKNSLEWQMASERHALNFFPGRMHIIFIGAAAADVKMLKEQRFSYLWYTHIPLIQLNTTS